ncbi:MAG TPA: hypothetical protein DCY06_07155, partial [Bacteroidetes bacterium]|nr:hypothetical protein [Bacteroidota bacterium]
GPFLRNNKGIGAYSFHDFPITNNPLTYINIKLSAEGLYNLYEEKLNLSDTFTIYIRNNFFPFQIRDSAKITIDSLDFTGSFNTSALTTGTYYFVIKGKNTIETWSKSGGTYIESGKIINYDFRSSASQAYGNNLKLIDGIYCIYSGDVNRDGYIDLSDLLRIDNDASNLLHGYHDTDIDRDGLVDLSDLLIAENNAGNFIVKLTP